MEIAIFWLAFAVISGWVLRRFYFATDADLVDRLRIVALIIGAAVLALLGWQLTWQSNGGIVAPLFLTVISTATFCTKNFKLLKIGSLANVVATVLLFAVMIQLMPGTVRLEFGDTLPIIAALLMLVNIVVGLLLWHQLQERDKLKTQK